MTRTNQDSTTGERTLIETTLLQLLDGVPYPTKTAMGKAVKRAADGIMKAPDLVDRVRTAVRLAINDGECLGRWSLREGCIQAEVHEARAKTEEARISYILHPGQEDNQTDRLAWVIINAEETQFRLMDQGWFQWTDDLSKAMFFATRASADQAAAEDPDDVRIVKRPIPKEA